MSQDLFAAFGSLEATKLESNGSGVEWAERSAAPPSAGSSHAIEASKLDQAAVGHGDEEEDDFGDFEDASVSEPAAPPVVDEAPLATGSTTRPSGAPPKPGSQARTAVPKPPDKPVTTGRHPFADHMDFLFAADDEDEYNAGADDLGDLSNNPEAAVAYSKRVIAAQEEEEERRAAKAESMPSQMDAQQAKHERSRSPKKLQKKAGCVPTAKAANVLFDAENVSDEEDDDGFGDFEGGAMNGDANSETVQAKGSSTTFVSPTMPAMDLLGLDVPEKAQVDKPTTDRLSSAQSRTPTPQNVNAKQPFTAEDDAWDDFEESAAVRPALPVLSGSAVKASAVANMPSGTTTVANTSKPHAPKEKTGQLPPTNIPPPSVLLSIFPSVFASAEEALFKPLAKLDFKQRQILLAHPATTMFLKGYLNLTMVLGHIIAGRKLRWKRDQYLAQGMRIGPAASGGGMKLAGIDKAELAKEEREVLDVVRLWKAQVGKLRSAVATANAAPGMPSANLPAVPEIAGETLPIKSLKPAEGGITAPHACALCGLKREERVAKVDVEVEDSFGEWWVQGMSMHLVCRDFWEERKGKLRSR
ncbi:hypothetical protein LTR85_004163 [Meristemomyces frigidus]|nr:hypothetical protein LTR85_004163 [Meristemomyces frigidus]